MQHSGTTSHQGRGRCIRDACFNISPSSMLALTHVQNHLRRMCLQQQLIPLRTKLHCSPAHRLLLQLRTIPPSQIRARESFIRSSKRQKSPFAALNWSILPSARLFQQKQQERFLPFVFGSPCNCHMSSVSSSSYRSVPLRARVHLGRFQSHLSPE